MKKIISILVCTVLILTILPQSLTAYECRKIFIEKDNANTESTTFSSNITFTKHIIDNNFDCAGICACDLDNDGDNDMLGASFSYNEIAWWRNDGSEPIIWTKQTIDNNFGGAAYVFAHDVDGDGDNDVLGAAWNDNEIVWWRNDGSEPIIWTKQIIKNNYRNAHEVYACDFEGDGDTDVFGASAGLNEITWWRNDGVDPVVWREQTIDGNCYGARSVYVSDIDSDGDGDVLGADFTRGEITWLRNDGGEPIQWAEFIIDNSFAGAHQVYACDIDDDGDYDALGTAAIGNEIAWWQNDGGNPIVWTKQIIDSNFRGALRVSVTDVDDDGDMDVLGTAVNSNRISWWRNDGGDPIIWTKLTVDNYCRGAWPLDVSDLDNDGDMDVIGGGVAGIGWYENHLLPKPEKPSIQGPATGNAGEEYVYTAVTTDTTGTQLFYLFDWGDSTDSEWIGSYNSGEECEAIHTWIEKGDYQIKVKAKNSYESESEWSDPLIVSIPKTYENPLWALIEKLFDWLEKIYTKEILPGIFNL